MAESPPAPFVMRGARAAMEAGLGHIGEHVRGIEQAVSDNPGLAFDLARTLIETVCRTILTERGVVFSLRDNLPKLFKTTSDNLPFLPVNASGDRKTRRSLAQTLNGLSTAVRGVCELRNACGFASHGSDSPRPALESVQALLAAETADAIVGFLHRVHCQDRASLPSPTIEFETNLEFNEYVDEVHESIRVFDVAFRPSEVLFQMEPETYRIYLADFEPETGENTEATK